MKTYLIATLLASSMFTSVLFAQSKIVVPKTVKTEFAKKYPEAKSVTWEKEKGNYEANWGGKSGEDNAAMFTPSGHFVEIEKAISAKDLPASALSYMKMHYNGASVKEAALVTDAKGKITYEAEINHKDLVFDHQGNFVKAEKE